MQNRDCSVDRWSHLRFRAQVRRTFATYVVLGACALVVGSCRAEVAEPPTLPPIETDLPIPLGDGDIHEYVWHAGRGVLYYINPVPVLSSRMSVLNLLTNESQEVANPAYCCLTLSIDGAVLFYSGATFGRAPITIYRLDTESGRPEAVADAYSSTYAISPDGTVLAWNDAASLVIRNFTTGDVQRFSADGVPISISPDHSQLPLYPGPGSIDVLSLSTGSTSRYTFDSTFGIAGIRWSPDGATFLLVSSKALLRFTPGAGPPQTIWAATNTGPYGRYTLSAASWSPDGRRLAVVANRIYEARLPSHCHCQAHLLLVDLGTGQEERLASAQHIGYPQYAEDGRSVVFASGLYAYRVLVP